MSDRVSTSAQFRQATAELAAALDRAEEAGHELAVLRERTRLPVSDAEVREWFTRHGLAWSCGPAVLFAALRRDFGQER